MKTIFYSTVFLMFGLLACKEQINELEQFDRTEYELWRSYNIHNYSIEQVRMCFCGYAGERMKITVISDTLFSTMRLSDFLFLPHKEAKYYLSIDSLFALIASGNYDSIVVSYNDKYGYPERVDVDPQQHPVDGGILYETSNLKILN